MYCICLCLRVFIIYVYQFTFFIFSVRKMMSNDIDMKIEKPANLPWYPPFCKAFNGQVEKYDQMESLGRWQMIGVKHPEKSIEEAYTVYSPENNLHEWGARVSHAKEKVCWSQRHVMFSQRN